MRFTEENVDLNRNFVDFDGTLPANPGYARVHEIIARTNWSDDDLPGIFTALNALREEIGEQAFSDALNGGQYTHPDGIFYGGARVQWSNHAFRNAVREHVAHAKSAAMIDLHTGIGPRNGHIFLCFHRPGSEAYARARNWWGDRAVNREGVTHKAVADYQGLKLLEIDASGRVVSDQALRSDLIKTTSADVTFSRDGKVIGLAYDHTVALVNVDPLTLTRQIITAPTYVKRLAFDPDGAHLDVRYDNGLGVYDLAGSFVISGVYYANQNLSLIHISEPTRPY